MIIWFCKIISLLSLKKIAIGTLFFFWQFFFWSVHNLENCISHIISRILDTVIFFFCIPLSRLAFWLSYLIYWQEFCLSTYIFKQEKKAFPPLYREGNCYLKSKYYLMTSFLSSSLSGGHVKRQGSFPSSVSQTFGAFVASFICLLFEGSFQICLLYSEGILYMMLIIQWLSMVL